MGRFDGKVALVTGGGGGIGVGDQEQRSDVTGDGARSAAAELDLVHADQDFVAATDDFTLLVRDVALGIPEAVLVDAFGAEQGHVEVPTGDFFERTVTGDHRMSGQEKTARDIDFDARQTRDQLGGRETGRDDLQVGHAGSGDGFGGEEDRRTRVQVDGHAGLDAGSGEIADAALGLGIFDLTVVERREVAVEVGERTTVRAGDPPLVLQFGQVAASRRFRDIELFADLQDRNVADFGEKFGDGFTAGFNDVSGYFHKVWVIGVSEPWL